jgi:hypothetical protein
MVGIINNICIRIHPMAFIISNFGQKKELATISNFTQQSMVEGRRNNTFHQFVFFLIIYSTSIYVE